MSSATNRLKFDEMEGEGEGGIDEEDDFQAGHVYNITIPGRAVPVKTK